MEPDIQRIQDTLGQMIQLSIMTDRSYKLTVRALGTFHINWTGFKEDHRSDLLWEYQVGRPVRVTVYTQAEVIGEYYQNLGIVPQGDFDTLELNSNLKLA